MPTDQLHQFFYFIRAKRRAMSFVKIHGLHPREILGCNHLSDERRLVRIVNKIIRFSSGDKHKIELFPNWRRASALVPAAQHAEEVPPELRTKNLINFFYS